MDWKGGLHSEIRIPRRRRGHSGAHTNPDIIAAVRVLARVCTDEVIAGCLNRNGLLTGRGNRWTRERVAALRSHHKIPSVRSETTSRAWMTLTQAAKHLDVSSITLRRAVERGLIPAEHPLPQGPWVLKRENVDSLDSRRVFAHLPQARGEAGKPAREQLSLAITSI